MDKINKNPNDVIFLFGAGISIPVGIPAMEGIYSAYIDKKKSGISTSDKKVCEIFIEMGVNKDLEELLLAANAIIEFEDSKLNRFVKNNISLRKASSKIEDYDKKLKINIKDVKDLKKNILNFLSRMCFEFNREDAVKLNIGFVDTLSKLGYLVYSTNYDFAFEYVAVEKGIKVIDNFIKKGQRELWNDKIDFEGKKGFKLIKLHGSVSWYIDKNGIIEKIHLSTNTNHAGQRIEKIVIVPTRFKDIYAKHFFALYSHFLSSLARAKVIIIAGHSLRDEYLRAGILERKRKGNFQIIVIDPNYPSEIKKELPPSRIGTIGDVIHLPYKWEEISDELSNTLMHSNSDQISDSLLKILRKRKYGKNMLKIRGNLGVLRPLETKNIDVRLEVYLTLKEKPSNLRVWLEASHKDTNGTVVNQISSNFIEKDVVQYGNDLSGLVESAKTIEVKIPKISEWIEDEWKVTLVVGLVEANVKKPSSVEEAKLIVKDEKILDYKS